LHIGRCAAARNIIAEIGAWRMEKFAMRICIPRVWLIFALCSVNFSGFLAHNMPKVGSGMRLPLSQLQQFIIILSS
jgi:hypothetical protein